ncbi:unnamed protein product, partial [Rotaria socialis]
ALRSKANANLIHSQDQATPTSTSTGKRTRKCSAKQKRKQAQVQQIISLDVVLTPVGFHKQLHEDVILKKDDATVEPTSSMPIMGSISPTTSSPTKNDDNDSIISLKSLNNGMAKEKAGWRCTRRNENGNVVIHISKQTEQFSRWNGIFHCHPYDARKTRKRDILNKIKHRVDEYISIEIIIEEEYRKANLSVEEKQMMPLLAQLGT